MTDPFSKSSTHVMSTNSEHFDRDVFEASHQTPIVVDFSASWCAPCRLLTPVMENLAATYEGRFLLVKVNTDGSGRPLQRARNSRGVRRRGRRNC